jgi:acetyl esterase/lipase
VGKNIPIHERPVVYSVSGMENHARRRDLIYKSDNGKDLLLDVYLPSNVKNGDSLPGVIFIHGGPVSSERNMKESGQYLSWGKLAAANGLVGITFNHRYYEPELFEQSASDVVTAVEFVRKQAGNLNLNPNRLCLWTCSGGGPHICFALRDQPEYVRCMVMYYAVLDVRPVEFIVQAVGKETAFQYSPMVYLQDNPIRFPIFIARAGLDDPRINGIMDGFISQALEKNLNIEFMNHSQGQHGFDIVDDDDRSRQIIARTLTFIEENV